MVQGHGDQSFSLRIAANPTLAYATQLEVPVAYKLAYKPLQRFAR